MLISNKKMLLSIAISSSLFSISYSASANDHDHHDHGSEHRQHGAHVHGVIEANIAQDGEHLLFEVTAPGADVVGFEHAPKNEEQKQTLSQAVKTLNNPNVIFTLPKDAKCTLEEVHVSHNLTNGDDEHHDHDHDHDHDQHDGEHHKEHSKHGEFNAQYEYHCEAISKLNQIETQWFMHFTHSQKMTVQYLGDSGQKATTLTADAPTVTL
ncbi:zinc uptake protein ZrgA [Aliivibrio sifiae]|uniref:zinc uptake protein ZrgA n=1 Tax=Aliivibrio sifiae TaxID=566293 RepID=UPI003D0F6DD8